MRKLTDSEIEKMALKCFPEMLGSEGIMMRNAFGYGARNAAAFYERDSRADEKAAPDNTDKGDSRADEVTSIKKYVTLSDEDIDAAFPFEGNNKHSQLAARSAAKDMRDILMHQISKLESQVSELVADNNSLTKQLEEAKERIEDLRTTNKMLDDSYEKVKKDRQNLQSKLLEKDKQYAAAAELYNYLTEKHAELRVELAKNEEQLSEKDKEIERLHGRNADLHKIVDKALDENKRLESELSLLRDKSLADKKTADILKEVGETLEQSSVLIDLGVHLAQDHFAVLSHLQRVKEARNLFKDWHSTQEPDKGREGEK